MKTADENLKNLIDDCAKECERENAVSFSVCFTETPVSVNGDKTDFSVFTLSSKNLAYALCGLSALMTTTVPAMEKTVAMLKRLAPWCKVVVGGAVLTEEYANKMGADKYAEDAMETVRYADSVFTGQ